MVQANLEVLLKQMIEYCENTRNHPFLEEVIMLYAAHMESTEQFLSAMAMYSLFLKIQESIETKSVSQDKNGSVHSF